MPFPGGAALRRRTLHRVMNELIESWEEGAGVREFVILTAQASDAHLEALSTIRTDEAHGPGGGRLQPRFRLAAGAPGRPDSGRRARHLAPAAISRRSWSAWSWRGTSRSRPRCSPGTGRGTAGSCLRALPARSDYPSLASAQKGELLYRFILDRVRTLPDRLLTRTETACAALRFCCCCCPSCPLPAQEPLETKLVVTQDGQEIGREEFTLRPSRGRGLPGTTIIAAARYPATSPTTPAGRHARAHSRVGARPSSSSMSRAPERYDRHPRRGVGRAADRAHRGQGLRVRPRAARRPGRGPARRRGVLALSPPWPSWRHPRARTLTGDLPAHGQAGHLHGPARVRRRRRQPAGWRSSGEITGTLVTDAQGRLERLELPGAGHGRHASRVATLPNSLPDN